MKNEKILKKFSEKILDIILKIGYNLMSKYFYSKYLYVRNIITLLKISCNRGGSGALYLQSAIVGAILALGLLSVGLAVVFGMLKVKSCATQLLRIVSGSDESSTKRKPACAARPLHQSFKATKH